MYRMSKKLRQELRRRRWLTRCVYPDGRVWVSSWTSFGVALSHVMAETENYDYDHTFEFSYVSGTIFDRRARPGRPLFWRWSREQGLKVVRRRRG